MDRSVYFPIIRSRDAELKGLSHVSAAAMRKITPVVEVTKSRRSKNNPEGDIQRSVSKIEDILDGHEFIADITSLNGKLNSQLTRLLEPAHGFSAWRNFVRDLLPQSAIPVAHLTAPFSVDEFKRQSEGLLQLREHFVVRIPTSYGDVDKLLDFVTVNSIQSKILPIIDAGFIPPGELGAARAKLSEFCVAIRDAGFRRVVVTGSSFPASVTLPGYGGDSYGKFSLLEVELSEHLKEAYGKNFVVHGDYACIYPLEFEGTVTNWVPRVDVPLNRELFYHRYRRGDGGYVTAAVSAIRNPDYVSIKSWAHENIVLASKSEPEGRSPSHWIAVRLNYHLERQAARLS